MSEHISELAKAIGERTRAIHEFDVAGFFGLGGKPIPKVAIWVNVKSEQDRSIVAAHKYVAEASGDSDGAKRDLDLLSDSKAIEVLFRACRDVADPKYPAFPGPQWMRDHLTTHQVSVLLNLYNEVARRESNPPEVTSDIVEAYANLAASAAGVVDMPESVLAGLNREELAQLFVLLAMKWQATQTSGATS